jgi:hypothetical protein
VFVVSGEVSSFDRKREERDTPPPVFSKDVILRGLFALVIQGCEFKWVRFARRRFDFVSPAEGTSWRVAGFVSHESFALSTSRKKQKQIVVNDYVWAFGAQRGCARTNSVAIRWIVDRAEIKPRSYKLGGGT